MSIRKVSIDLQLFRSHAIRYCNKHKVAWLAGQADVTPSATSMHIMGSRKPPFKTLHRYATAMDREIETYIHGTLLNKLARLEEEQVGFKRKFRPSSPDPKIHTVLVNNEEGA